MSTFLGIVIAAVSVFTLAVVAWAFIWAAKKDGEDDRAVQKRLGPGEVRRRVEGPDIRCQAGGNCQNPNP